MKFLFTYGVAYGAVALLAFAAIGSVKSHWKLSMVDFWLWAERRAISAVAWCRWMTHAAERRAERRRFVEEQSLVIRSRHGWIAVDFEAIAEETEKGYYK